MPRKEKDKGPSVGERVIQRLLQSHSKDLQREYVEDRAKQAEELHNGILAVIGTVQPSVETIMYVFRVVEHELCFQELRRLKGPGETAAAPRPQPVTGPAKAPGPSAVAQSV